MRYSIEITSFTSVLRYEQENCPAFAQESFGLFFKTTRVIPRTMEPQNSSGGRCRLSSHHHWVFKSFNYIPIQFKSTLVKSSASTSSNPQIYALRAFKPRFCDNGMPLVPKLCPSWQTKGWGHHLLDVWGNPKETQNPFEAFLPVSFYNLPNCHKVQEKCYGN